jgi:RNA polymerase sigma factor (sigma-70 family)
MSLRFRCDTPAVRCRMKHVNAMPAALAVPRPGRAQPFADVVAENLDAVYRYLVYLTGDRAAAEDLAAETFEKAFRGWRRFDPSRGAPRTWLCRIAHSVAVDWFRAEARRQRREETYMRDAEMLEESVFADGFSPQLERSLHRLTPAEREVVALRVLLELDGPSAARVLGISQTACSTRLSRALTRLEEEVGDVRE